MNGPTSIHRLHGAETVDYFLQVLRAGGAVDIDPALFAGGGFGAVAPTNLSAHRVKQFSTGGLLDAGARERVGRARVQAVPTSVASASALVANRMPQFNDPIVWVHEPLLQQSEISAAPTRCQSIGGHLYLVYEDNLCSSERIAEIIAYSMLSWHFLAFVTDGIHAVRSASDLAAHAQMMLVGAYDGESVLFWERSGGA